MQTITGIICTTVAVGNNIGIVAIVARRRTIPSNECSALGFRDLDIVNVGTGVLKSLLPRGRCFRPRAAQFYSWSPSGPKFSRATSHERTTAGSPNPNPKKKLRHTSMTALFISFCSSPVTPTTRGTMHLSALRSTTLNLCPMHPKPTLRWSISTRSHDPEFV